MNFQLEELVSAIDFLMFDDDTTLTDAIDDAEVARAVGEEHEAHSVHLSKLGHTCQRSIAYDVLRYPTDKKYVPHYVRSARVGTFVGEIVADGLDLAKRLKQIPVWEGYQANVSIGDALSPYVPNDPVVSAIEVPLQKDTVHSDEWYTFKSLGLGGRIDAIAEDTQFNEIVVEVKSHNSRLLYKNNAANYAIKRARWYIQTQLYMWARGTRFGAILQYNRDDDKIRPWNFPYNESVVNDVLKDAEVLAEHINAKTLPEGQPELGCTFCHYKSLCSFYTK